MYPLLFAFRFPFVSAFHLFLMVLGDTKIWEGGAVPTLETYNSDLHLIGISDNRFFISSRRS